jgi:hypothetical protein
VKTSTILAACLMAASLESAATAGQIKGRIGFSGEAPKASAIRMDADPKCIEIHGDTKVYTQSTVVSEDGGLANVFVYIKNPPAGTYPAPSQPVSLSQKGCLYSPRVQGILVDQTLEIHNNDDTLHNVRALASKNRPFNLGQPPATPPRTKTFKLAEPEVRFRCDVHPWMTSYVFVMEHPFFGVSGADGTFTIDGLPAGTYTVVAWHEKSGEQEAQLTVTDAGSSIDFEFTAP